MALGERDDRNSGRASEDDRVSMLEVMDGRVDSSLRCACACDAGDRSWPFLELAEADALERAPGVVRRMCRYEFMVAAALPAKAPSMGRQRLVCCVL